MSKGKGILLALWEMCCALLFTSRVMAMDVDEAYRSIPHRRTVFDETAAQMPDQEKNFLQEFFSLIDQAIVAKVEIVSWINSNGLKGRKEGNYDEILKQLSSLETPDALKPARQSVIEAIKEQRQFLSRVSIGYSDIEERGIIPRPAILNIVDIGKRGIKAWADRNDYHKPILAQEPLVVGASHKLIKAYQILMQVYPRETAQNKQAFFDYLCALDFL